MPSVASVLRDSVREKYIATAIARAGLTPGALGYFYDDFTERLRWTLGGGAGTVTAQTNQIGGVVRVASGAGASDLQWIETNASIFGAGSTARWYMAARIKLVTTPTNTAEVGVFGTAEQIGMGVFISGHATKWNLRMAGSSTNHLNHSADFDTSAYHVLEAWQDATNIYFSVDGTIVSAASTQNTTTLTQRPIIMSQTAAGGGSKTFDVDWVLYVHPHAA